MTRAKAKPQRLKWTETPDGATCVAGEYAATIVYPTEVRLYRGGVRVEVVRRGMSCLDHGKEIARRWLRKQISPTTCEHCERQMKACPECGGAKMCPRCGGSSCNRCLDGACVTCDGSGEVEDSPLRRARRRIEELEAAPATHPAWRPIETAPRDEETEIIVGHADWRTPAFVRWTLKPWWHVGRWVDEAGRIHYDPTHWLPLSALPAVPR